jgi:hypothetical protein
MTKKTPVRRTATLADLMAKPVRTKEVAIPFGDEIVLMKVKSINTKVYDDLVGEHPPTKEQKAEGSPYNLDTFGPALLAACTFEPTMNFEEAEAFWSSDEWSRGELLDWFMACLDVCNQGFRVPSIASDSE